MMTPALSALMPTPEQVIRPVMAAADTLLGSRGCLFTFHRAAETAVWETLPNRDFYLDLSFLDRLLGYLKKTGWKIVTVEEAVRRAVRQQPGDRYVNFSVDDCYRDTFELVVPLFRRHGVPVTLYVTTGIPDATLPLVHAGLEDLLWRRERVVLDRETLELHGPKARRAAYARLAAEWERDDPARRYADFCARNGADPAEIHRRHAIDWDMLEALRHDPLVEIGAHTVRHARISTLSPVEALAEIVESRERLQDRLGIPVRHFAFPYGRSGDCGPRDFELARAAGFASAATTRKGLLRRKHNAFSLPRNTLVGSHRSLAVAELHLAGLTGVAARVAGRV